MTVACFADLVMCTCGTARFTHGPGPAFHCPERGNLRNPRTFVADDPHQMSEALRLDREERAFERLSLVHWILLARLGRGEVLRDSCVADLEALVSAGLASCSKEYSNGNRWRNYTITDSGRVALRTRDVKWVSL